MFNSLSRRSLCLFSVCKRTFGAVPTASQVATNITKIVDNNEIISIPSGMNVHNFIKANYHTMNAGKAFHTLDIGTVEHRFAQWRSLMPRVDPWYAVKCNNDPMITATLFAHNSGFDCASRAEIEQCLNLGCAPERIIFANPAKFEYDIEYAASVGVTKMTFDSEDELEKIKRCFERVNKDLKPEPIVRVVTDDRFSTCRFSAKFGAPVEDAEYLLNKATELGLEVIGTSFHAGSGCQSSYTYTKAIEDCRSVFDIAYKLGHKMYMLDLGGGFLSSASSNNEINFTTIAKAICTQLDASFPPELNADRQVDGVQVPPLHVIAEPGRYFAGETMNFVSPIIARRLNYKLPSWITKKGEEAKEPHVSLTTADGVYGAYNCMLYDHAVMAPPLPLFVNNDEQSKHEEEVTRETTLNSALRTKIFGPTCDGLDCIFQETPLPEMKVGDWLIFPEMGAYTIAAQSSFNGIQRPPVKYIRSDASNFHFNF